MNLQKEDDTLSAKTVAARIAVWQPRTIDIEEVTLLSVQEYYDAIPGIAYINGYWWLRTPNDGRSAYVVNPDGYIDHRDVCFCIGGVRPVLKIKNTDIELGEEVDLAERIWTMVLPGMLLCDETVGYLEFRRDREAPDANDYEASDVKRYLNSWAKENGLID